MLQIALSYTFLIRCFRIDTLQGVWSAENPVVVFGKEKGEGSFYVRRRLMGVCVVVGIVMLLALRKLLWLFR